jgi:hypothetical protein
MKDFLIVLMASLISSNAFSGTTIMLTHELNPATLIDLEEQIRMAGDRPNKEMSATLWLNGHGDQGKIMGVCPAFLPDEKLNGCIVRVSEFPGSVGTARILFDQVVEHSVLSEKNKQITEKMDTKENFNLDNVFNSVSENWSHWDCAYGKSKYACKLSVSQKIK